MSDSEANSASAKPSWGGPLTQADYAKAAQILDHPGVGRPSDGSPCNER